MNKLERFFHNFGMISFVVVIIVVVKAMVRFLDRHMGDWQGIFWLELIVGGVGLITAFGDGSFKTNKGKVIASIIFAIILLITIYWSYL